MGRNSGTEWSRVMEENGNEFESMKLQLPANVDGEKSFRLKFEELCKKRNDLDYHRMLVRLNLASINIFATTVDNNFNHVQPSSLAVLVFGGCLVAVQESGQAGVETAQMVGWLGQLNKAVPSLAQDVPWFHDNFDVQKLLQDIFMAYMKCLLAIIDYVNPRSTSHTSIQQADIQSKIDNTAKALKSYMDRYSSLLDRAQQADTRAKSNSWSSRNTSHLPDDSDHSTYMDARFRVGKLLGKGSYGQVHEMRETSTGKVYARKTISLRNDGSDVDAFHCDVRREYETMERLIHSHIVRMTLLLKDDDNFYIFMLPVADQNLRTYLDICARDRYPSDSLRSILQWFGCLLEALEFAHLRKIIHRDIKPSNILVTDDGDRHQVYLADFGLAKDFTDLDASTSAGASVRGTPLYRAPEVRPNRKRGLPADVFSLGCVFSEMLTIYCRKSLKVYQEFRSPRSGDEPPAFRANLPKVRSWLDDLKGQREGESSTMVYLILKMIQEDASKRWLASAALKFLKGAQEADSLFCAEHFFEARHKNSQHPAASSV